MRNQSSRLDLPRRRRRVTAARSVVTGACLALTALAGAACRDLTSLQQSNPSALDASIVFIPANATLLTNGVIADFECAFSRYVAGSGLFADELSNAVGAVANYDYDRRTLPTNSEYGTQGCANNQRPPIYTTLSTARASGDTVAAKLRGWTDAEMPVGVSRVKLIGQAAAYAGYSIVLLGEGMCSAAINIGPELTPAQLFAEAKIRFDSAVVAATAANDAPTLNFALLGRARAELDLGDAAAAGVDAAKVPSTFVLSMSADAVNIRRENFVFYMINFNSFATVDATFRGLTINGAPDPRVAVTNAARNGTAPGSLMFTPDKYTALSSTIPIARYAEAQLIVAESKLAANDLAGAVAAINIVRASRPGVPAYDGTGQTAAQIKVQIIEDRRRELFLEGHRLGDLRRYNLPFLPAAGTAYPGGGGLYGTQTCFPLPDAERVNNPNIPKTP